jgi:hypothetical protein
MVRLGLQGVELLTTGRLTLPMKPHEAELVKDIRTGKFTMQECLDIAELLEDELRVLKNTSSLRPHPDRYKLNRWLIDAYRRSWLDKAQWGYTLG